MKMTYRIFTLLYLSAFISIGHGWADKPSAGIGTVASDSNIRKRIISDLSTNHPQYSVWVKDTVIDVREGNVSITIPCASKAYRIAMNGFGPAADEMDAAQCKDYMAQAKAIAESVAGVRSVTLRR